MNEQVVLDARNNDPAMGAIENAEVWTFHDDGTISKRPVDFHPDLVERIQTCEQEIHTLKAECALLRRRIGRALDIATDDPPASVRDVVRVLEGRSK